MSVTIFSFLMTALVCNLIMALLFLCCRSVRIVGTVGLDVILFFCFLCAVRICLPIEFGWTREIPVPAVYNPVYDFISSHVPVLNLSVMQLALILWVAVSFCLLIQFAMQYWRRSKRVMALPEFRSAQMLKTAKRVIPAKQLHRVRIVPLLPEDVPATIGVFRPVIMIPVRKYKSGQLELILQHEITHVIQRDNLSKLMLELLRILFWWCPAMYLFRHGFETALEMRCDSLVTGSRKHSDMLYYLKTLAAAADRRVKPDGTAIDLQFSSTAALMQRVDVLLRYHAKKKRRVAVVLSVILALLVFIASYSFVLQTYYDGPVGEEQFITLSDDFQVEYHSDGTHSVTMNGTTKIMTEEELTKLLESYIDN